MTSKWYDFMITELRTVATIVDANYGYINLRSKKIAINKIAKPNYNNKNF